MALHKINPVQRPSRRGLVAFVAMFLCAAAFAQEQKPAEPAKGSARMDEMNRAFLEHVRATRGAQSKEAEFLEKNLREEYHDGAGDAFIPDALALLSPEFRAGVEAFDAGQFEAAQKAFEPLVKNADEYVAASATYYHARSLVERGLSEEAERTLEGISADSPVLSKTPYAAHLLFLKGYSQAADLRYDAAATSLKAMLAAYPNAPEAIAVGAKQLLVEIERRQDESLDEVSNLMNYAAQRITVKDTGERVRETQDRAVELLDRMIEEEQKKEGSCSGGGKNSSKNGNKRSSTKKPQNPAEQSVAPEGSAEVGEMHNTPRADPEQSWGNLPPSEREKILQSLRERFPSRYRHLVEQYYRSLAEQK